MEHVVCEEVNIYFVKRVVYRSTLLFTEKNALFNETSQNERAACSNTVCEEKFDFMLSSSASRLDK